MYWMLMYKDEDGKYWLYVVKADSIKRACTMTGLEFGVVSHCVLTENTFDHLKNIEGGYIRMQF